MGATRIGCEACAIQSLRAPGKRSRSMVVQGRQLMVQDQVPTIDRTTGQMGDGSGVAVCGEDQRYSDIRTIWHQ